MVEDVIYSIASPCHMTELVDAQKVLRSCHFNSLVLRTLFLEIDEGAFYIAERAQKLMREVFCLFLFY